MMGTAGEVRVQLIIDIHPCTLTYEYTGVCQPVKTYIHSVRLDCMQSRGLNKLNARSVNMVKESRKCFLLIRIDDEIEALRRWKTSAKQCHSIPRNS